MKIEVNAKENEVPGIEVDLKKLCIYCESGTGHHVCMVCSLSGAGVEPHLLQSGAGFGAW